MKTTKEFNDKWSDYLEEGFYGLDISNEDVINYLDKEFEEYTKDNPDFRYEQIKLKWDSARVYTNAPQEQNRIWEIEIDLLIENSFSVYTLSKQSEDYRHWAEELTMIIHKEGAVIELNSREIQKLVKSLPRTIGGQY